MKAVIFDMDGLMFDTERIFVKAWDYAGDKIGIGKAGYMVLKTLGMNIEMSKNIWIKEFGHNHDEKALKSYTKEFLVKYYNENTVPVKNGLFDLIEYLHKKDIKMAVASSSPKWEVLKHLNDSKIINKFEVIMCGDMVEKSKPDPTIYLKTCELLNEEPKDCYALEDSKNGILSACKAGCNTIMVPDLWEPNEEINKLLYLKCDNLNEVKGHFIEIYNESLC